MQMPVLEEGEIDSVWVLKHDIDPDPWLVTYGGREDASTFDLQDWLDAMVDFWNDDLRAVISDEVTLERVRAQWNNSGSIEELETVVGTAGLQAGDRLPSNCSLLVRKNTGFAGRKNRGRMFWPGILDESQVDQVGTIDTATVAALQTVFAALFTKLSGVADATPAILHKSTPADDPTPVVSHTVMPIIATQRRRLR